MGFKRGEIDHGEMAEWSIAAVLKTVELRGSGGSNPSLSAKRLQSDCKMVVTEAFIIRGNRCRTWSYNDFSLYAVYRPDGLPLGTNRHQSETIATARSNKVAVCLGFQDFSQLTRDYGYKESKVIQNTVGNVFSSQVVGAPPRPSPNDSGRFCSNGSP